MMFLFFAFVSMVAAGILSIVRIHKTSEADPEMTFSILLLVNLGKFHSSFLLPSLPGPFIYALIHS